MQDEQIKAEIEGDKGVEGGAGSENKGIEIIKVEDTGDARDDVEESSGVMKGENKRTEENEGAITPPEPPLTKGRTEEGIESNGIEGKEEQGAVEEIKGDEEEVLRPFDGAQGDKYVGDVKEAEREVVREVVKEVVKEVP